VARWSSGKGEQWQGRAVASEKWDGSSGKGEQWQGRAVAREYPGVVARESSGKVDLFCCPSN